jgi:hypothetical protein
LELELEAKGVEYEIRMLAKESAWFGNKKIVLDKILSGLDQDEHQLEVSLLGVNNYGRHSIVNWRKKMKIR